MRNDRGLENVFGHALQHAQNVPIAPGFLDTVVFDLVETHAGYDFRLFGAPNMPVDDADYLLGLQTSTLVRDGGTPRRSASAVWAMPSSISVGCGNGKTRSTTKLLADSRILDHHGDLARRIGGTEPFAQGLYGASEMFVNGFLHLYRDGILKRKGNGGMPASSIPPL